MVALPILLELAALIVALGLIYCGKGFVDALLWIVRASTKALPFSGFLVGALSERALQKLSNVMGGLANDVGASVSASWHFLAQIVDRLAWTTFHTAVALNRLFAYVTVGYPLHVMWAMAKRAEALALRAGHVVGRAVAIPKIIYQTVTAPASSPLAPAVRWLTRGLRFRLTRLEKMLAAVVITVGGAAVAGPAKIGYTWKQLRAVLHRLRRLEAAVFGTAAVATFAVALRKTGLGWMRCDSFKRLGKGIGCTGFAALEELLAPAVAAFTVLNLCSYALAAQRLARVIVPELGVVLLVEGAVCLGGGASLPSAHDAPTLSPHISFPSADG